VRNWARWLRRNLRVCLGKAVLQRRLSGAAMGHLQNQHDRVQRVRRYECRGLQLRNVWHWFELLLRPPTQWEQLPLGNNQLSWVLRCVVCTAASGQLPFSVCPL
jgi:hypothetical protein